MLRELEYPSIGARLHELREEEGLSLRRLARRSGVSKSALSKIENGATTPTVESVERIAVALDTPITSLWPGQDVDVTEVRALGPGQELAARGAGSRPRHVIAGEGMLDCVESFTFEGQTFKKNVTRVAPDHPAARERPEMFWPAYKKEGSREILRWLEMRRDGKLGRTTRASNHGLGETRPSRHNGHGLLPPTRAPRQDWGLN